MKRSFYNPATHIGTQPVRVLKWNVANQLENVYAAFLHEFNATLQKHGLKPCLNYDHTERAIVDAAFSDSLVPFVSERKEITIQETFLSLVWTMCYSHLVLFEEQINKPLLNRIHGHNLEIDQRSIALAGSVYGYGVSLVRNFTSWDKDNIPNPEEYDPSDIFRLPTSSLGEEEAVKDVSEAGHAALHNSVARGWV